MEQTATHKNYENDTQFGKNGVWYEGYFFPVQTESPENTIVKTLYSSESYISRCPGYCNLKKFYLTQGQMKKHECRKKCCKHFVKTPYNEVYWKRIEEKKANKKLKKMNKLYNFRNPNKKSLKEGSV